MVNPRDKAGNTEQEEEITLQNLVYNTKLFALCRLCALFFCLSAEYIKGFWPEWYIYIYNDT